MPQGVGYPLPVPQEEMDDQLLGQLGLGRPPMLPPMPPAAAGGDFEGGAQPEQSLFDTQGPSLTGGSVDSPVPLPPGAGGAPPMAPGFAPGGSPEEMARIFVEKMMGAKQGM